jgi:hypothetical protein
MLIAAPIGPELEDNEEMLGDAASTVRDALAFMLPNTALIFELPTALAVASPAVPPFIVATGALEEAHVTFDVRVRVLPSE